MAEDQAPKEPGGDSEAGQPAEVSDDMGITATTMEEALRGALTRFHVAGVEIKDPKEAYANLQNALGIVKRYFKVGKNDLYFRKFPGAIVGEATEEGVAIDPIMLMHPALRLAHVIAHEAAHKGGEVDNEGLVEAYVKALGFVDASGLKATEKYNAALENFYEFVSRVSEGRETTEVVKELYGLYYSGEYERIYELYKEKYIDSLAADEEKDAAHDFFETVFPELQVRDNGKFHEFQLE